MKRRYLLGSIVSLSPLLLLTACPGAQITPAEIVSYAQGIVSGLLKAVPIVSGTLPKALPSDTATQVTGGLNAASGALSALAANLPPAAAGQTVLTQVEGWINAALDALAVATPAAAVLFPPLAVAVPIIQAATVLLPMVEAFVSPSTSTAALRARAMAPAMTVEQAKAVLGITA